MQLLHHAETCVGPRRLPDRQIGRLPSLPLQQIEPQDPRRGEVQAFINAVYGRHYGAHIVTFMPTLFGLWSGQGRLLATAGCRSAASGPLMLEQYLDAPVEQYLRPRGGRPARRGEIREIGHLASPHAGAVQRLIADLAGWLLRDGCNWVVFTATPRVREIFAALGIELHLLAAAEAARLAPGADHWGSYYEQSPAVCAGNLAEGLFRLQDAAGSSA